MLQRFKILVLTMLIGLTGALMFTPALASATFKDDACQGVSSLNGGASCSGSADKAVSNIIKTVITILSVIVGFIAVIMVIVGGMKMITASGDSSAIASGRTTIIYALVGLIIVAVAQVLVHFVIFRTGQALK